MKILFTLNHAPHYRELFLRRLGKKVSLTVYAKPCLTANLIEPDKRENYVYLEGYSNKFFLKFGLQLNRGEWKALRQKWDKVILSWDLHHVLRYVYFFFSRNKRNILWMGHIYGTRDSKLLKLIRKLFINRSGGVLTYSDSIRQKLIENGIKVPIWSFNNSEVSINNIQAQPFEFIQDKLKLLYVGRFQKRKQLQRLVDLAKRNSNVNVRIAGNGVKELFNLYPEIKSMSNIELFGETLNNKLIDHMAWSDIIANPGHLGLLVINGARFGRPILVDGISQHAPEIIVAKEADQFFINWNDANAVDEQIERLIKNRNLIKEASERIVKVVKAKYTVEFMADVFEKAIMHSFL